MWDEIGGGLSLTVSKRSAFERLFGPVNDPARLPEWNEADSMKDTDKKYQN